MGLYRGAGGGRCGQTHSHMAITIEIFKVGRHTATSGETHEFSEKDIRQIASSYRPGLHEAPIVIGHPKDNAPAWGWTKSLHARQKTLLAVADQVEPSFQEAVKAGRYKKVSASLYAKDSPSNPTPGQYYLRHIGFLGAAAPAVKGLGDVQFSEKGAFTIEFAEGDSAVEGDAAATAATTADKVVSQAGAAVANAVTELVVRLATAKVLDSVKAAFPDIDATKLESTVTEAVTAAMATPPDGETSGTALQRTVETALVGAAELPIKEAVSAAGAAAPAVGAADATGTADHTERTARERELKAREDQLAASERRLRRSEHETYLAQLGREGKVLPITRAQALDLLEQTASGTLSFAEGQPTAVDLIKKVMGAIPKTVEFGEIAGTGGEPAGDDPAAIARAATAYQNEQLGKGIHVSTSEAVRHVRGSR